MVTKKELRLKAKTTRTTLDLKAISENIVKNILTIEAYKKAKNVLLFYPLEHEINLIKLVEDKSKNFYLPKIKGNELAICPYKIGEVLTLSKFKTKEPDTRPIDDTSILDVVFVPALMVDKTFNRLGYGGGFYDRFLSKQSKNTTRITPIASVLIVDEIPADNFDERINAVVCENIVLTK